MRPLYRARQFFAAVGADRQALGPAELAEAVAWLPAGAMPLFAAMSRGDQRHSLTIWRLLQAQGHTDAALAQAALLHDCAKQPGGVRLWHRVAVVLVKALWPARWSAWAQRETPPHGCRYPFWAHAQHPRLGAALAAAAGCDPVAVQLIRRHQEPAPAGGDSDSIGRLLAAFQAVDDDQ